MVTRTERTLIVKLIQGESDRKEVRLFFQAGDWAVTEGLCLTHSNRCFRLTHVPSTGCIPVCITIRPLAEQIARKLNAEVPKFRGLPKLAIINQQSLLVRDMLREVGHPLLLSQTHPEPQGSSKTPHG